VLKSLGYAIHINKVNHWEDGRSES